MIARVELISVGNELLSGRTVNTNLAYLSKQLIRMGIGPQRHTVLPDDPEEIQRGVGAALGQSSLVIVTGGLGPTLDDVTQAAVESALSASGQKLPNRLGSACGMYYEQGGKGVILLPGVPREMVAMFEESARPIVARLIAAGRRQFIRSISFCLKNEKEIDPLLRELQRHHPQVRFGIYPAYGSVTVELKGSDEGVLERLVKTLCEAFPTRWYQGTMAEALHQALRQKMVRLALAESCTGGAIAAALTRIPGASDFLLGAMVTYSNASKEEWLGVSSEMLRAHGAVSRETAIAMAEGILERTRAELAAAVTGIAGPTGGSAQKPVGTVYIAIARKGGSTDVGRIQAPPDREAVIEKTVNTCLGALWLRVVHNECFSHDIPTNR